MVPIVAHERSRSQCSRHWHARLRTFESKHGYPVNAGAVASEVSANDFDAVIIPGGYAPDRMRRHQAMIDLVRDIYGQGKIVAMICHAGWLAISARILPEDHRNTA